MTKKLHLTSLGRADRKHIEVRGMDLTQELMGKMDFGEFTFFYLTGRKPSAGETVLINAVLISMVEHGVTPAALTTRLMYMSAPDSLQGAVASGLLGAGSVFLGAVEGSARLLQESVRRWRTEGTDMAVIARELVAAKGKRMPGFGHPTHYPDDPRAECLRQLAREHGVAGDHCEMLTVLSAAVDSAAGRHIVVNVMGGLGAVLSDMGFDWRICRGFPIISRSVGLVGAIAEEIQNPSAMELWTDMKKLFE